MQKKLQPCNLWCRSACKQSFEQLKLNSTHLFPFLSWVVIIIENLDVREIHPANCNVMHARYVGMSVAINLLKIILCVGSTDQYNLFHNPIWRHKEVIIALCRGAVHICIKHTTLKNSLSSTTSFEGIVHKAGLEIRPVFVKLRFWVCRTPFICLSFWGKNQAFLKKSYCNWSRVNRYWIFIRISIYFLLNIPFRTFLPISRFFVWNFGQLSSTLELLRFFFEVWVFLLEFFSKCRISKPVLKKR